LRICFISSYPPNRARLSEYAKSLLKELANRPAIDKIYVLVDTIDGSKNRLMENSKVEVLRVWKADNPFSILSIILQILKLKPDVVHFNVHFQSYGRKRLANFIGLSLVFLCRLLGLRVVASVHNFGEKVNLEKVRLKPSLLNRVGILVATKLILSASRVVVTVRSYAEYLRRRYGHKGVLYIPHGTSANACSPIDPDEKVVLMFGHMGPSKGLPIMLKAFEELMKERSDVKLVVAGSSHPNFPGYLDEFVKTAIPKVTFLGYVHEEDLARVFGMADVVVLPYLTATGTSGVFHLACGYGKPVVSSDLPEIREMVAEGASALLVPPGDVGALKDAILKVLFNEEIAAKMSEQNLMFAQREQWSIVAEAYEEAYLELLNS
jgi:glycosyltransferase involved in cell wall biosynthesis